MSTQGAPRAGADEAGRAGAGTSARADALAALATRRFDLLVIGGGITGAGIARDAALRGLDVALVERDDFASGTSSRSSRLIHGGVRYLEYGHLHLVFESSRERRALLRIAPHLVRPLEFTWPVYRGARVPRWKLRAGLLLYDALALFRNVGTHRPLDRAEVLRREPTLRTDGLLGGAGYFDAATDDARLTLANAVAAAEAGAVVVNHAEARAFLHDGGAVRGATVADREAGEAIRVDARVVVNSTGPWTDELRRLEGGGAPGVRGTKGAHVAVPRDRIRNRGALTLLSPADGRVMFVLPAGAHAIIGTTDTPTDAAPDDARASEEDVAYLLASANAFFPTAALTRGDVVSAWAGIRPLVASGFGANAAGASREHDITRSASGLVTVTGGKLTTYRAMAAEVVDVVEGALGRRRPARATTDRAALPGGDMESYDATVAAARATVGDARVAERLVQAHGSRWREVWAIAERAPALRAPLVPGLPYLMADCVYAAAREMARTLADVLIRRTHVAFETADAGRGAAPAVARVLAAELAWSDARVAAELVAYEREAARMFGVDA